MTAAQEALRKAEGQTATKAGAEDAAARANDAIADSSVNTASKGVNEAANGSHTTGDFMDSTQSKLNKEEGVLSEVDPSKISSAEHEELQRLNKIRQRRQRKLQMLLRRPSIEQTQILPWRVLSRDLLNRQDAETKNGNRAMEDGGVYNRERAAAADKANAADGKLSDAEGARRAEAEAARISMKKMNGVDVNGAKRDLQNSMKSIKRV